MHCPWSLAHGEGGPHTASRQNGYVASITRRLAELAGLLWDLSKTALPVLYAQCAGVVRLVSGFPRAGSVRADAVDGLVVG